MNRRETVRGGHRSIDTGVHRKEKENRKLQLELRTEKEKLNSTMIKYQRELTDMQAVSRPPLHASTSTNGPDTSTCVTLTANSRKYIELHSKTRSLVFSS